LAQGIEALDVRIFPHGDPLVQRLVC